MSTRPAAARSTCGSDTLTEADECGRIRDDDLRVAQSDEGDEQADSRRGTVFQAIGDAVDDLLTNARERQEEKKQAGEKNNAQHGLPRNAPSDHDRIGEVGVERHAGRQRDRIIRPQPHHERRNRGREARREEHAVLGHARLRQNLRIDHDDVRHGHERGQAGEKLDANRGVVFAKMK